MSWRTAAVVTIIAIATSGCVSMMPSERSQLRELEGYGVRGNDQAIKNPGIAGALNILPGFGNFYLAVGSGESSQWAIGFLNLLAWPFSVVWGIPEAAIDASTINRKETLYHYTMSPVGRREFAAIKAEWEGSSMVPSEHTPRASATNETLTDTFGRQVSQPPANQER